MDDAPTEVVPDSAPTDLISKDIDLLQDENESQNQESLIQFDAIESTQLEEKEVNQQDLLDFAPEEPSPDI